MKKIILALFLGVVVLGSAGTNVYAEPVDPVYIDPVVEEQNRIAAEAAALLRQQFLERLTELTQIILNLQEKLDTMKNDVKIAFPDPVLLGYTNDSIKLLQEVLASDPVIYPEGLITGYFGLLTEKALIKLQQTWGLQANGLFTQETRFVLNQVLVKYPFASIVPPYLANIDVLNAVAQAKSEFKLIDLVVDSKVAFSKLPIFSKATPSADTATLQRILATDPVIYPEKKVTGIMDNSTDIALAKFQARYGLVETSVVDTETLDILKSILIINNQNTIADDLLLKDAVQANILVKNFEKKIFTINATRDYTTENVLIVITYRDGSADEFFLYEEGSVLATTAERDDVMGDLVKRLKKPLAEIDNITNFAIYERPPFPIEANIYVSLQDDIILYFIEPGGKSMDAYEVPKNIDWSEEITFNGKKIILREVKDHVLIDARAKREVDKSVRDVIKNAVAESFGVRYEDVPDFAMVYTAEVPPDPSNAP